MDPVIENSGWENDKNALAPGEPVVAGVRPEIPLHILSSDVRISLSGLVCCPAYRGTVGALQTFSGAVSPGNCRYGRAGSQIPRGESVSDCFLQSSDDCLRS